MRKWLLIAVGIGLVGSAVALLWPKPDLVAALSPPAHPAHEFKEVSVVAEDEGLTLTGRVLDPRGQPVPQAQVFLASSAQENLTTVKCDECKEMLLSCRGRETGPRVLELLQQHRGFLTPAATTRADGEGKFRFEHLAGVSFTVWAHADGLGEGVKDRAAPGDPVELFLPPLRSIAGTVEDDRGQPLPGARIHAVSRRVPLGHETASRGDGVFELTGLGQGPFYVLAEADGFLPQVMQEVEAGPQPVRFALTRPRVLEVETRAAGAPVEAAVHLSADHLDRSATAGKGTARFEGLYPDQLTITATFKDLTALPRTVTLDQPVTHVKLDLERGGTLSVTVVDDRGQPVPEPELSLLAPGGEGVVAKRKARTGELAILGPLAVGDYALEARAEGFKPVTMPVAVKVGDTPIEAVLSQSVAIEGRVLDEYGRPAAGISILISPLGDNVEADDHGHFVAQVPTPGLYDLHAHHSEWGGGELRVSAPASNVELHLEPHASAEITVQSEGRRVEGADVVLWQDRDSSYRSDRPSGADGVVMMRGIPAGTYWVVAAQPEFLPSDRQKVVMDEGDVQHLTVELKPGARLVGDVVDADDAPVVGASVTVSRRAAEPVTTDGKGHFELRALRPGQTYAIEVRHPNYEQTERANGTAGGDPVKVVLKRRSIFRGRVLGENGSPVRRFHVDDRDVSSPDGTFELPLSSEGDRVIFAVEAVGYEPQMVDRPATPDLGDITLNSAPMFSGVVHDEGGAPVSDAAVSCDVCNETVLSGGDGKFNLSRPPYATTFVVSARKGAMSGTQRATASASGPIEVVIHPAVHLTGLAFMPDGTPAAGEEIEAINMDRSEPYTVVTGQDGRYVVDIPAGNYRFNIGSDHAYAGTPIVLADLEGSQSELDLGPVPGSGTLTLHVQPEPGFALWVIQGDVPSVTVPSLELLRVPYGQMVYSPRSETVTLQGLPPGSYTVIWSNFHVETPGGPIVQHVEVPGSTDVTLTR